MEDLEPVAAETKSETLRVANMLTLEIVFLSFVGLVVVAAFIEALSYKLVSSRTPFVIMVPLLILIVIHARRLYGVREKAHFSERISAAFAGRMPSLNKVVAFSLWMALMLVVILGVGHYIGIFLFCFILMYMVEKERLVLALIVAAVTTLLLFVLFEFAFNVDMYRGLFFRWMAGYRDFG